ncbi:MAG: nucleotidyl transferase AbiEii/AbiGii toxin family protein [Bacteroidota bacterium]|nr:nucleotidyl transferase AbiEii/AbiGii toxin family protein [Bacteroidota bacterium]
MLDFIHNDPEFKDLLSIVSSQKGIDITLVEKDYWIMHALYSLQQQGIEFELKGGTSLSKGYGLIHRFSEDIDIHIRNTPINISSWIWEHLISINARNNYINNTAIGVQCYHPGYTLVEKLQTIVRKYRNIDNPGASNDKNFMRQYYDIYCLLGNALIQEFIGSPEYLAHKATRIKGADNLIPLNEHPALLLNNPKIRESFTGRYLSTAKLYYIEQPDFEEILARIAVHLHKL